MKLFTYYFSIAALLSVIGPAVAEEATGTSAAIPSSLLVTIRADVPGDTNVLKNAFPDPDKLTLLGSVPIAPNKDGYFQASSIGESGNLHKVFTKIVHLHWSGGFEVPQDGDFILTMTGKERCANDYKIGGELLFPVTRKRHNNTSRWWEVSANIEGTSKGDWVEIDFTDFCKPTTSWKDFERHQFYLDAFFLNTGEPVRITKFRPKLPPS